MKIEFCFPFKHNLYSTLEHFLFFESKNDWKLNDAWNSYSAVGKWLILSSSWKKNGCRVSKQQRIWRLFRPRKWGKSNAYIYLFRHIEDQKFECPDETSSIQIYSNSIMSHSDVCTSQITLTVFYFSSMNWVLVFMMMRKVDSENLMTMIFRIRFILWKYFI